MIKHKRAVKGKTRKSFREKQVRGPRIELSRDLGWVRLNWRLCLLDGSQKISPQAEKEKVTGNTVRNHQYSCHQLSMLLDVIILHAHAPNLGVKAPV